VVFVVVVVLLIVFSFLLIASESALIVTEALFTFMSPVPPSWTLPPDTTMSFNVTVVDLTLRVDFTFNVIVNTVSPFVTFEFFNTVNIFVDEAYVGVQLLLAIKFDVSTVSKTFLS